ncbi:PD-(D/E)XK nuclease family protein [Marinifilum sp. RC60d5]|uniref:PD-(D/E)XK nuclease family protein n=1 Tax=Marinifilum sp. RC60d5 TaxID=3458414 RepID=UPI004035E1FC
MFSRLLRLIQSNTERTPLEDYTTELLVGVLENDCELRDLFCNKFLGLESKEFIVESQKRYKLEGDKDCIIDVVITGENEICFIENKVKSKEGEFQLERYSKVLKGLNNGGLRTKLAYCTERSDPKYIESHDFIQYKWHDVACFFKNNSENILTKLFIDFLIDNKMSRDMTIKSIDLVTMENLLNVVSLIDQTIDNVKDEFEKKFGNISDYRSNSNFKKQIVDHERMCVLSEPAVKGNGWSEILYGVELNGTLVTQIYIEAKNENHDNFKIEVAKQDEFEYDILDDGTLMYLAQPLGDFLNNEDSESEIEEWFLSSFNKIEEFIDKTKGNINWNNNA